MSRLGPEEPPPAWAWTGEVVSVTRTPDELSVVCAEAAVPDGVRCERGFFAFALPGPIPFTQTGVIASIVSPLAAAAVSVFALATFDTDLVLVRESDLPRATRALRAAGHEVEAER